MYEFASPHHVHLDLQVLVLVTAIMLLGTAAVAFSAPGHARDGRGPQSGPLPSQGDEKYPIQIVMDGTAGSKRSKPNSDF